MPRWYNLIPAAGTWLGRFYGIAILALGAVSLYWGTRGFLALLHGIRADWSDPRACGIALVIAGLSFWAAYHLLTNPALARDFAGGGKSRDGFGGRSIRRNLFTVALLTGFGVLLLVGGDAVVGAAMLLSGLIYLAFAWHFRHDVPLDPEVDSAIQQALKLERGGPAATNEALERAFEAAERRAEQHLTELRNRATYDRRAAVELRNLLRAKLKLNENARRRAQRVLANRPHGAAVLEALARTADTTRQRLLEAQQYVDRYRGL